MKVLLKSRRRNGKGKKRGSEAGGEGEGKGEETIPTLEQCVVRKPVP